MDTLGIESRRLGTGLLVFGVVGFVLAAVVAGGLLAGAVAARNLDERLASDQARVVALLDRAVETGDRLATTTANGGQTLQTTSETVAAAAVLLDQLASASDALSDSLDFSVFGQQPLAGAATRFGELGTQVRAVRGDVDRLSQNLATNAQDVSALAEDIDRLQAQLADVAARVAEFDRTDEIVGLLVAWSLLLGLLAAWLALAAVFMAFAGWRLRRVAAAALPAA